MYFSIGRRVSHEILLTEMERVIQVRLLSLRRRLILAVGKYKDSDAGLSGPLGPNPKWDCTPNSEVRFRNFDEMASDSGQVACSEAIGRDNGDFAGQIKRAVVMD